MSNLIAVVGIVTLPFVLVLCVRRSWLAVVLSTVSLTLLVHLAGYIGTGYADPFFVISIPIGIGAFFVWSVAVTWIVRRVQHSRGKSAGAKADGQSKGPS